MPTLTLLEHSPTLLTAVVFVIGLVVGSFLNVVIHRLPKMLERQWREQCAELTVTELAESASVAPEAPFNLVRPRSACPLCHAPIAARHNIPLLAWLWLRGRCAHCHGRISLRYPLVELLTGLLSALVAWRFGYSITLLYALVITWYLVAMATIDLQHLLLPDILTLPLMWGGLLASLWAVPATGQHLPVEPRAALLGAITGYLLLWTVYQLFRLTTGKEGMGYGDFKLLAALGAWMGWKMLLPIVLLSALAGALVGIAMIVLKRRSLAHPIPFGPFLAAAGFLVMVWGPEAVTVYLGLFSIA